MGQRSGPKVGVDLFDDGVATVGGLGLQHLQRGVGEDRVVTVGRKQFTLFTLTGRDGCAVEAFDPAHDQPPVDVLGFRPGGERGERDLGDLRIGDQPLLLLVPDRVRVVDRGPRRLLDAGVRELRAGQHLLYVPLIRGDRVSAELDSFSCLQVTALERPAPFVLTVVMSKTPVSQAEMTDMGRLLEDAGTSVSEGHAGVFVTTWDQPGSLEDVTSVVASLLAKHGGWRLTEAHEPAGRFDLARDDLDLDRSVPHTFETDYWAPDDPQWAALGITDPRLWRSSRPSRVRTPG